MRVTILGAGKVGRSLARALRARGHSVVLRRRRARLSRVLTPLLVVTTRDDDIAGLASELALGGFVTRRTAVVHAAGGLGPEALEPIRKFSAGVAQAHPLLSFAAAEAPVRWEGASLVVRGDPVAVRRAGAMARAIGMVPRAWEVEPALYHAAAALLANGAASLAGLASALLVVAGAPHRDVARALGPLLESVAQNVAGLGLPSALTGPVRRGDAATVKRHLAAIRRALPEALPAYVAVGRAQLPFSKSIGEASERDLARLARALSEHPSGRKRARRRT